MKLTPAQHAAIHRSGQDVCVIAGPGSGKTRVLAERFAWLVEAMGVSPRNILALTFTEKAASEIRHRVAKTKHADIDLAPISTLHGLCQRILKEFSIAAGLDPSSEIWDERLADAELHAAAQGVLNAAASQERAALRSLFTIWNTNTIVEDLTNLHQRIRSLSPAFPSPGPPPNLPSFLLDFLAAAEEVLSVPATTPRSQEFQQAFTTQLNRLRDLGTDPTWQHIAILAEFPKRVGLPKLLREASGQFYDQFQTLESLLVSALTNSERNYLISLLSRIATAYAARKRDAARLDFNDLEHHTLRLLQSQPRVREELQRRFEHILMDEMQDTNPIQWQLVDLLRTPGSFFAVGDINQSIYGFRFADPYGFRAYRESLEASGAAIDILGTNFRSRAEILSFTETVSRGLSGINLPEIAAGRNFTTADLPVSIHPFEKEHEEFKWLAEEIKTLKDTFVVEPKDNSPLRRLSLSDIAILVRTANKAESIAAVLADQGIPFTLGGGRKFFDSQEVTDLLSYLHLLANPLNTIARAAVLRSPFGGLSDAQILHGESSPAFDSLFLSQRQRLDAVSPDLFLVEALDASGYSNAPDPAARANIEKMLRIVREVWQAGPRNLPDFVAELELIRNAANEKSAPLANTGEAVQILTVHASKGLEFPVVFVAGAYFTPPNSRPSLCFAPPGQLGIRFTNPANGKVYPDYRASLIETGQKQADEEELHRMLYVALTRAEQRLYVSWCGTQARGWVKYLKPHSGLQFHAGDPTPLPPAQSAEPPAQVPPLQPLPPQLPGISSSTPTELATYAECPRRYFLDHLAQLKSWPSATNGSGATQLGTIVHQLLAGQQIEDPPAEALQLVNAARLPLLDQALWVEREFDFVFSLNGLVLEGQIDLCFETPAHEIHIVDYKTGFPRPGAYDVQLAIYREALARLYPNQPIRAFLFYLRTGEIHEVSTPLHPQLLADFQQGDHFPLHPGPQCQRCPHLAAACPVTS